MAAELTVGEAFSGIFGAISLCSWIYLLVPQLILNYRNGNAEGLSLGFLVIWLLGDITNLAGSILANLVNVVILIAGYFCFADLVLIGQTLWYNKFKALYHSRLRKEERGRLSGTTEESPLIPEASQSRSPQRQRSTGGGLPGSHRRRVSSVKAPRRGSITRAFEEPPETGSVFAHNGMRALAIVVIGTAGWALFWAATWWKPDPNAGHNSDGEKVSLLASGLGYTSAALYLTARLPQIYKNWTLQSTEGLSTMFFLISIMGNLSYGLSIISNSRESEYLLANLPWLIGSLGTIAQDGVVFYQFAKYGSKDSDESAV